MKIFLAHNHYQQPGGEDRSVAEEAALLEDNGHTVHRYTVHNDQIDEMPRWRVAQATLWNPDTYRAVRALLRRERPDVAHFHNTFPLLSPSVYYAARAEGVPTVQTLHNFRLFCLNGYFYRDGGVCTDCLGALGPLPGVAHACYRDSRTESLGVAALQVSHRLAGTWASAVDRYIALTPFGRRTVVEAGLPADRVDVKPNFLRNPPAPGRGDGGYAVFVGRLSEEKGLRVLLEAWPPLASRLPLTVVGDGPLAPLVESASHDANIRWAGWQASEEVFEFMKGASMLIFPSGWYEGLPRTIIEAFSVGTPVIATDHGAMSSLIDHGRTGRLFEPGSVQDLRRQVRWALDHPDEWRQMRSAARAAYDTHYTPARNHEMLMDIYRRAQQRASARSVAGEAA